MSDGKNILETVHDVAQDVLVPRLKALEVEMTGLRVETKLTSEAIREEMRLTSAAIREESNLGFELVRQEMELVRQEMKFRFDALQKEISESQDRLALVIRTATSATKSRSAPSVIEWTAPSLSASALPPSKPACHDSRLDRARRSRSGTPLTGPYPRSQVSTRRSTG